MSDRVGGGSGISIWDSSVHQTAPNRREGADPKETVITDGQSWCIGNGCKLNEGAVGPQVMVGVKGNLEQSPSGPAGLCLPGMLFGLSFTIFAPQSVVPNVVDIFQQEYGEESLE